MFIYKTQLLFIFVFLVIVLYCDNKDPVSNNNTDAQDSIVADIDGNIYHVVKIGNQVWTMEDLRTTRFNNGTYLTYDSAFVSTIHSHLRTEGFAVRLVKGC